MGGGWSGNHPTRHPPFHSKSSPSCPQTSGLAAPEHARHVVPAAAAVLELRRARRPDSLQHHHPHPGSVLHEVPCALFGADSGFFPWGVGEGSEWATKPSGRQRTGPSARTHEQDGVEGNPALVQSMVCCSGDQLRRPARAHSLAAEASGGLASVGGEGGGLVVRPVEAWRVLGVRGVGWW
jgi:hypothetical protein